MGLGDLMLYRLREKQRKSGMLGSSLEAQKKKLITVTHNNKEEVE